LAEPLLPAIALEAERNNKIHPHHPALRTGPSALRDVLPNGYCAVMASSPIRAGRRRGNRYDFRPF
jgi:hypothetical protein